MVIKFKRSTTAVVPDATKRTCSDSSCQFKSPHLYLFCFLQQQTTLLRVANGVQTSGIGQYQMFFIGLDAMQRHGKKPDKRNILLRNSVWLHSPFIG